MLGEVIHNLGVGFAVALLPENILYAFVGSFLGTIVGILPGLGPAGAMAMILPAVFTLHPASAIIMLASAYAGAMYGGSTTSILLNVPGENASVVTCLDGYQMALQGRAGPALCIAAIGSFIAGTMGIAGLMLFGPIISKAALSFGSPEYFALMVFALSAVASLSGDTIVKGLLAMTLGLMVATVGTDMTGVRRYCFNLPDLLDGVEFFAVTIGLFAISEVIITTAEIKSGLRKTVIKHKIFISFKEFLYSSGAIIRGSIIGFSVGVLPGAGAGVASFLAYSFETQISRHPEKFGKGEIKGVAAPESANNAASAGALIPMLTLGVPGSGTTAIMLAALMGLNVNPGPLLFSSRPDVVWGLIAAMYLGNIILLILNLPLVGIFVRILYLPLKYILPLIMILAVLGVYSANMAVLDLVFLCLFGLLGYYMRRNGYPIAPVILGIVLGGQMEVALRQTMIMSQGQPFFVFERPIVIFFLVLTLISIFLPLILKHFTKTQIEYDEA